MPTATRKSTVEDVLGWLEAAGTRKQREGLLRYGIVAPKAFGVSVGALHGLVKRAAFALLASLAAHDEEAPDSAFLRCLPLIERAASDERNFVKKGVSWALRLTGRRSPAVYAACMKLATRLAASGDPAAAWVGRDALRDLGKPAVRRRLAKG